MGVKIILRTHCKCVVLIVGEQECQQECALAQQTHAADERGPEDTFAATNSALASLSFGTRAQHVAIYREAVNDEAEAQDERNGRHEQAVRVGDLLARVEIEVFQETSAHWQVLLQSLVENDQQDENRVDDRVGDDDVTSDRLVDAITRDVGPLNDTGNKHPEACISLQWG